MTTPHLAAATARPHIMVIDPCLKTAEHECFNALALMSSLPLTYHLPAMFGMTSLQEAPRAGLRGLVILGSAASVYDRAPWQDELESWLSPVLKSGTPTLGICYGHQMLAHMFGGRVEFAFPTQKKLLGFRSVELGVAAKAAFPWTARRGVVAVSHNETVTIVPDAMEVMAKSAEIPTDGLRHRELPIFSFQSHPEATRAFLRSHEIEDEPAKLAFGQEIMRDFFTFCAAR